MNQQQLILIIVSLVVVLMALVVVAGAPAHPDHKDKKSLEHLNLITPTLGQNQQLGRKGGADRKEAPLMSADHRDFVLSDLEFKLVLERLKQMAS